MTNLAGRAARWTSCVACALVLAGAASSARADEAKEPRRFTWGATADAYWSVNLNDPATGRNTLRAFDVEDRNAKLAFVEGWLQCARKPAGFRLDVDAGDTAKLVNAFEPSQGDAWEHVQQAYASVNLNRKGSTYLDVGKWVTPAGAEVIEARDNWLYSRGLLFTWAIPFYHAGVRVYHYTSDTDYVMVHVNRGWNAVGDAGGSGGAGVTLNRVLAKGWTLTGSYLGSDEPTLSGHHAWLHLIDFVALYQPGEKWTWTFNADLAVQDDSTWHGVSVQGRYAFTERDAVSGRAEYLSDNSGRVFGQAMTACSATLGYNRTLVEHLSTRVEYRHDFASEDVFPADDAPRTLGNEGTLTVALILAF